MHEEGRKELWSDEQLHTAVEAVSNRELKAHAAAKQYGIPSHTLYDHINGKSTKYGGAPTVLTAAEEECQVLQTKVIRSIPLPHLLLLTVTNFKTSISTYNCNQQQ